jgi:hypothetical protein
VPRHCRSLSSFAAAVHELSSMDRCSLPHDKLAVLSQTANAIIQARRGPVSALRIMANILFISHVHKTLNN